MNLPDTLPQCTRPTHTRYPQTAIYLLKRLSFPQTAIHSSNGYFPSTGYYFPQTAIPSSNGYFPPQTATSFLKRLHLSSNGYIFPQTAIPSNGYFLKRLFTPSNGYTSHQLRRCPDDHPTC